MARYQALSRRLFLAGAASGLGVLGLGGGGRLAVADAATDRRLVICILRGGLDGLSLLPPVGDPDYAALRGRLAEEDVLPLAGTSDFGLHPSLREVGAWAAGGEVLGLHAAGLPDGGGRSHFEAQDMLEGGGAMPRQQRTGWLSRALTSLSRAPDPPSAVAVGSGLPLVLRGPGEATSIDPSLRLDEDEELMASLERLYADDPELAAALAQGWQTSSLMAVVAEEAGDPPLGRRRGAEARRAAAISLGQLLASPHGPRIAVVEVGGWDTHANQQNGLRTRLEGLDGALGGLRQGLGVAWGQSAILLVTEFGRTVLPNGTGGTDHGSGGAALLVGGVVRGGGGVRADWPGLKTHQRLDGRDLRPTTDVRAVFKGLLRDHLGVDPAALDADIFPDSRAIAPLEGLVRSVV